MNSAFGPRDVSRLVRLLGEPAPLQSAFARALYHHYPSGPTVEAVLAAGLLLPCQGNRLREPVLTQAELEARYYGMEDPYDGLTVLPLAGAAPRFSYFDGPISNTTPRPGPMTVHNLHSIVTDPPKRLKDLSGVVRAEYETHGKSPRYDEQKKRLDYFAVGGIFGARADKSVFEESGLLVLDLDKMHGGAAQAKDQILSDEHLSHAVALIFVSPSGDGLKVLLAADAKYDRLTNYRRIDGHLRSRYAWGTTLDKKTADLSRACFVCHDPKAYINTAYAA